MACRIGYDPSGGGRQPDRQAWLAPGGAQDDRPERRFVADGDEKVRVSCGIGKSGLLLPQPLRPSIKACRIIQAAGNLQIPVVDCATK
jgi:hypothetical protein